MAHFYDSLPAHIRALSDTQAIEEYVKRADVPRKAIAGLSREQLNSFPIPGTWSIQQIVVHLLDSDLTAAYRMKRVIAEDHPKLDCYDETAFSQKLSYDKLPINDICEIFRLNRQCVATILLSQPAAAFNRIALHPEIGEVSLGQLIKNYVNHVDHHMVFIEKKRKLLGAGPAL